MFFHDSISKVLLKFSVIFIILGVKSYKQLYFFLVEQHKLGLIILFLYNTKNIMIITILLHV